MFMQRAPTIAVLSSRTIEIAPQLCLGCEYIAEIGEAAFIMLVFYWCSAKNPPKWVVLCPCAINHIKCRDN